MNLTFALIGEGAVDSGLVSPLESLCSSLSLGQIDYFGSAPDVGFLSESNSLCDKIAALAQADSHLDFVFVHRDSDSRSASARLIEISAACQGIGCFVPVVPIQETEAWALVDEQKIKQIAGNPGYLGSLGIPALSAIENTASPKEILHRAIRKASGAKGRKLSSIDRRMTGLCTLLIEGLDIHGPVTRLSAWQSLISDTRKALLQLTGRRDLFHSAP